MEWRTCAQVVALNSSLQQFSRRSEALVSQLALEKIRFDHLETGVFLRRWCGSLKRVMWYFEDGVVVL